MITPEQLEELQGLDGRIPSILSAYLDLDPSRQARRSYRIALGDLVKKAGEPLDKRAREALELEAARVHEWLDTQRPRGMGLALFSCTPRRIWQAHFLAVRVKDHLTFEPRPDIAPLLEILDEYERYAVALVDKEKARLFTVFMGEIEESDALKDLVPGKTDEGGLSQPQFQRHHELHVHWHLKRVAQRLAELLGRRPFDRLILGGPEEATSELRHLLPRALAQRLVAVIPAETESNEREILDQTLEIEQRIERENEERTLHELLDAARPGGRGILGREPTLEALWCGAVQTLVVVGDDDTSGSECSNCGRLAPGIISTCPECGSAMHSVHDLFHQAMAGAVEQAGRVEVVHGQAARRLQDAGRGMGALLRYRWPAADEAMVETLHSAASAGT